MRIEEVEEGTDLEGVENMDANPQLVKVDEPEPLVSLHVVTGKPTFQTLKAIGRAGKHQLLTLVESRSSHNFLDSDLAAKLKCQTQEVKPFQVSMADGNKALGTKGCKDFTWTMQGELLKADTLVLPLYEYDLILGV